MVPISSQEKQDGGKIFWLWGDDGRGEANECGLLPINLRYVGSDAFTQGALTRPLWVASLLYLCGDIRQELRNVIQFCGCKRRSMCRMQAIKKTLCCNVYC